MSAEQEPFLDLGRARSVKGRAFHIRLPLAERLRAARGVPQAVVKVTSYTCGKARMAGHLRYISRQGKLPLETDRGLELISLEDQRTLTEDWATDFDSRPHSRDAVSIVFSMPPGSDVQALKGSVRATLSKSFPDNEWVFAIHEDRDHPHAHALVKMRGREQAKKLRLNKPQLYQLREVFAESARAQGVRLAASPRAARGIHRKGLRQAVYHMRRKGSTRDIDKQTKQDTSIVNANVSIKEKSWEEAQRLRHQLEKDAYLKSAQALRLSAQKREPLEREKLERAAEDLERFAQALPSPQLARKATREQSKVEKTSSLPKRPSSETGFGLEK